MCIVVGFIVNKSLNFCSVSNNYKSFITATSSGTPKLETLKIHTKSLKIAETNHSPINSLTGSLKDTAVHQNTNLPVKNCTILGNESIPSNHQGTSSSPERAGFPATYRKARSKKQVCKFCLKNGEIQKIYESHVLKDKDGFVACPILRVYKCELCGATGDFAHTKKYCPMYEKMGDECLANYRKLPSNSLITTKRKH